MTSAELSAVGLFYVQENSGKYNSSSFLLLAFHLITFFIYAEDRKLK